MAEELEDLVVRFPARRGYLAVCRLNATAVAATAGFDVDQLDDIRLAVDEAITWLLADGSADQIETGDGGSGGGGDGEVELTITCSEGRFMFVGVRSTPGLGAKPPDDLLQAIFGATVDQFDAGVDEEGRRVVTLTKRLTEDG